MGFTLNKEFETKIDVEEVALITVAFGYYIEQFESKMDRSQILKMKHFVDRLGVEMYSHPDNNEPNGH